MWVRSQHKIILIDANNFYIEEVNKNFDIVTYCNSKFSFRLGTYLTQEKAKKVLDMIQKNIGGKSNYYIVKDKGNENGYEVLNNMYTSMQYCKDGVFQMPQDKEV